MLTVPFPVRQKLARLALALVPMALLLIAPAARAQFSAPETTHVLDASALKPPPGAHIAMIEFYDLECPVCAQTNPTLIAAANEYKIPWIRYDFLIPYHIWSRQAAINARFFDATKGQKVGNEYRDYVMANQTSIETMPELNIFTQRFAQAHGVTMPFAVDPMGKFAAEVEADVALGKRIGITHTPTVFIVASGGRAPQYTEVVEPRTRLFQIIDQVEDEAKK
jgi:protein-disulfide isomerase